MKRRWLSIVLVLVLLPASLGPAVRAGMVPALPAPQGEAEPDAPERMALSLRVLQGELRTCQTSRRCPENVLHLAGLTRVDGYVVDQANDDLVLFGVAESAPKLHVADLVVALRNDALVYAELRGNTHYYSAPGCSIDPDPDVIRQLQRIGNEIFQNAPSGSESALERWNRTCRQPQTVRVLGIPFNTHFAKVMVDADHDMKRIVDGTDQLEIPGFDSLLDMTLAQLKSDIVSGRPSSIPASSLNRFWFYPGENQYEEDRDIVGIAASPVTLLTEVQFVGRRGNIVGSGDTDRFAKVFADKFTERYSEIAQRRSIYAELEGLFRFVALVKVMTYKKTGVPLEFLLKEFATDAVTVPATLPGRANVMHFEHREDLPNGYRTVSLKLPSCGGVSIELDVNQKKFRPDAAGRLARIRDALLAQRPSPQSLAWNFTTGSAQRPRRPGVLEHRDAGARRRVSSQPPHPSLANAFVISCENRTRGYAGRMPSGLQRAFTLVPPSEPSSDSILRAATRCAPDGVRHTLSARVTPSPSRSWTSCDSVGSFRRTLLVPVSSRSSPQRQLAAVAHVRENRRWSQMHLLRSTRGFFGRPRGIALRQMMPNAPHLNPPFA
jgi:hypothetical protein